MQQFFSWNWILALVLVALLLGLGGMLRWRRRAARKLRLPHTWQITARPVFGNEERRFYRHLCLALPQLVVLSKLPLVRFCQPTNPQEARYWHELLGSIHVTFAICSASGRVLAAIDVDNDHGSSRRASQIKESVLAACRVQYLRCPADHLPSPSELQQLLPPTPTGARSAGPTLVDQSRDKLSSTVASRRQARATNWQDSRMTPDSILGPDLTDERSNGGGVVVDKMSAPFRH